MRHSTQDLVFILNRGIPRIGYEHPMSAMEHDIELLIYHNLFERKGADLEQLMKALSVQRELDRDRWLNDKAAYESECQVFVSDTARKLRETFKQLHNKKG